MSGLDLKVDAQVFAEGDVDQVVTGVKSIEDRIDYLAGAEWRSYNTADATTNYERVAGRWAADEYTLVAEKGGVGTTLRGIAIDAATFRVKIDGTEKFSVNAVGAATFVGAVVAAAVGPSAVQQHTFPAVASDTVALLAAVQSFTNKTLDGATFSGTLAGTPTVSGAWTWSSAQSMPGLTLLTTPLAVASGGTGAATFTANGVLYGNGTSAVQVTAQGGANTVLTANAGAPSFSATPTLTGLTLTGLTAGSVLFAGAGGALSQDNANLFWDDAQNRLGVGTNAPGATLDVRSSASKMTFSVAQLVIYSGVNDYRGYVFVRDGDGGGGFGAGSVEIGSTGANALVFQTNNGANSMLGLFPLAVTAGVSSQSALFQPALTEAASGVHALLAGVRINALSVTPGTATVTDAATLYVAGAPNATVTGRNYYALMGSVFAVDSSGNAFIGTLSPAYERDLNIQKSKAGGTVGLFVRNADTTNTASDAVLHVSTVGGGAAYGNPYIQWEIGGVSGYQMGIDSNDGNKLKISNVIGSTDYITISGGNVGIGFSPTYRLDVTTSGVGMVARLYDSAAYAGLLLQGNNGAGTTWALLAGYTAATSFTIRHQNTAADRFIIDTNGSVSIPAAGPHAIGTTTSADTQFRIGGTFTPTSVSGNDTIVEVASTINLVAGDTGIGVWIAPVFAEAASGAHALIASATIAGPNVTPGVATVGNTAALYISGASSATVTGVNYALWVVSGRSFFGGTASLLDIGGNVGGHKVSIVTDDTLVSALAIKQSVAGAGLYLDFRNSAGGEIGYIGFPNVDNGVMDFGADLGGVGSFTWTTRPASLATQMVLSNAGSWTLSSTGPHAIGQAVSTAAQLAIGGTFTGASQARGFQIESTLVPTAGNPAYGINIDTTFTEAASGVHALFAGLRIGGLSVNAGVATVTNTAALYIAGPMTATVTGRNYAIWSDAGEVRIDGPVVLGGATSMGIDGTLRVQPTATSTSPLIGLQVAPVFTKQGGSGSFYGAEIGGTYTLDTGALQLIFAQLAVTVSGTYTNSGTLTSAAGLYIQGPPMFASATNYAVWVDDGASRFDGDVTVNGRVTTSTLTVTGTNSAIGGGVDADIRLALRGSFTGVNNTYGVLVDGALTGPVGGGIWGLRLAPTLVEAASGVHGLIAGIVVALTITNGTATATDAAGVDIETFAAATGTTTATGLRVAAPTGGASNYAINVTSGDIYKAGSAYTNPDFVFERYYTGAVTRYADRLREFQASTGLTYTGLWPLAEVEEFARKYYHLPMLSRGPAGMFARGDMLLAVVEEQALYLFDHEHRLLRAEQRIAELETELAALRARHERN